MAFVTTWPHANNRRAVKITPAPPTHSKMQKVSQLIRIRVPTAQVPTWQAAANERRENLSEFIRAATNAACAGLTTSGDWKVMLNEVIGALHIALDLRTVEQKDIRIQRGLDALKKAMEALNAR